MPLIATPYEHIGEGNFTPTNLVWVKSMKLFSSLIGNFLTQIFHSYKELFFSKKKNLGKDILKVFTLGMNLYTSTHSRDSKR